MVFFAQDNFWYSPKLSSSIAYPMKKTEGQEAYLRITPKTYWQGEEEERQIRTGSLITGRLLSSKLLIWAIETQSCWVTWNYPSKGSGKLKYQSSNSHPSLAKDCSWGTNWMYNERSHETEMAGSCNRKHVSPWVPGRHGQDINYMFYIHYSWWKGRKGWTGERHTQKKILFLRVKR